MRYQKPNKEGIHEKGKLPDRDFNQIITKFTRIPKPIEKKQKCEKQKKYHQKPPTRGEK